MYLSSANGTTVGVCLSFCITGAYVPRLRTGTLLPSDAIMPFELASVVLFHEALEEAPWLRTSRSSTLRSHCWSKLLCRRPDSPEDWLRRGVSHHPGGLGLAQVAVI